MTADFIILIGLGVLVAVFLWSFWHERQVTRAALPAGEMVQTPLGEVHVIRRGHGVAGGLRPLVLIHGSTTNALDLDLDLAGRFSDQREVIIIDRPGHGFSPRPTDGWRLDVQAKAIHQALKALGVEHPVVCGQSYGGAIALRYALDYPEDLAGLVLLAAVSHRWPGGVAWYNRVGINPWYGRLFRRTFIALYGRFGSPRGVAKALRGSVHLHAYHARTRAALTFRPRAFRHNAEDIVRLYEQLVAMDQRYGEIDTPTELVAGTHDMTVITSVHGQSLAQQIPNANLEVIQHAGHALHHTHPEAAVAAINRLDERLASGQGSPLQGALRRLTSVFPRAAP